MAMAWISLGGLLRTSALSLGLFFLSSCALGQRVVGIQPGERLADSYFFIEDSSQTFFVSTFGNRAHDVRYIRAMAMSNGKHFPYLWNDDCRYIGVEVVSGRLHLFYAEFKQAADSLLLWNTTMDSLSGWTKPEVIFASAYSYKNRTPSLNCRVNGNTLVIFSQSVLYATKELMHFVFRLSGETWKVHNQMNWKVDRWGDHNEVERWTIDSSGNVIVMTGNNRQMEPKEDQTVWTQNVLYYFDIEQTKLKQWDLVLGDRVVREAFFREGDRGMICYGLYSQAGNEKIAGWITYELDTAKREVVSQKVSTLNYPSEGNQEWILKGYLPTQDGFWIYGEDYYFREIVRNNDRWTTMSPGIVQYLEYYMEIYLLRFDTTGQCVEVLMVPKAQEVNMDELGPSFVCYRKGAGIQVQYNDHVYNTPLQKDQRHWVGSKTAVRQIERVQDAWKVGMLDREEWKKGLKMNLRWWPITNGDGRYQVWVGGNSLVICEERKD